MTYKKKHIRVLDLFAGAGGFGLGFRLASDRFKLLCALEIDKWAVETLSANNSEKQKIIQSDIRSFDSPQKILVACPTKPDVIIGGPPCQGFSIAGPAKDAKDPRNSLFRNFSQWVDVLRPKVFVMENVKGLLTRKNEKGEKVIEIIKKTFNSIGYTLTIWELNAANFGVPQNRPRIFIVGNKFNIEISAPHATHYLPGEKRKLPAGKIKSLHHAIRVIEAISDLPKLKAGEGKEEALFTGKPKNRFQKAIRDNTCKLYNHVTMSHSKRVVQRYEHILEGLCLQEIPEDLRVRKRNGNGEISDREYNSNYRHLKPKMISYTIPASFYSNFVHPNQPRNITAREAARLQSFPDWYFFKGKRTQVSPTILRQNGKTDENHLSQYNQIGNAVPPFLAKAVAQRVLDFINQLEQRANARKKRVGYRTSQQ